jgi:predicted RND superfamily exporter protein
MLTGFQRRFARAVLLGLACLVPPVVWGAWHAYEHRDNGVLGWLPARAPATRTYREFLRIFGPDETVLVSWDGCTLDDPRLEAFAQAVEAERAAAGGAGAVASVSTGTRLRDAIAAAADIEPAAAAARLQGSVVGPDGFTTCAVVTLAPLDDPGRRAALDRLVAAAGTATGLAATDLRLTGDAVISAAIDEANERTAATWSNVSMVVALGLAWLTLRSMRLAAMVLAVAGFSSLAVEAVIHFSGGSMNMLVSLVPVVTFVLAISAAVHLLGYWSEALGRHDAADAADAAVAAGFAPSLMAAVTTVFGMVSLCVSEVRPVWSFGFYGAIGTGLAFAIVFLGLPALLRVFPPPPSVAAAAARGWPAYERAVCRLLPAHRMTTVICLAAMAAAGAGLAWMRTEVRPARFLPVDSAAIRDLRWFEAQVGPFQTVDVVLAFDTATTRPGDRAAVVQELHSRLQEDADVRGGMSAATFLPEDLRGGGNRGAVGAAVRRGVIDSRLRRSLPALVAAGMVADEGSRQWWRISLQVANFTATRSRRLQELLPAAAAAAAEAVETAPPAALECTGGVPVVIGAQQELLESLLESFAVAFVTIAALMAVFLRSLPAGLVAMIPNVFPVVIVFGLLGWAGRPLDVGGMMTASIALGIAVDDTMHLLAWVRRLAGAGLDQRERIEQALRHGAAAMTRSSLILGGAFAVFGPCGFQPIAQFGLLLAVLLGVALVGDIVQLPALLAGPAGRWFAAPGSAVGAPRRSS